MYVYIHGGLLDYLVHLPAYRRPSILPITSRSTTVDPMTMLISVREREGEPEGGKRKERGSRSHSSPGRRIWSCPSSRSPMLMGWRLSRRRLADIRWNLGRFLLPGSKRPSLVDEPRQTERRLSAPRPAAAATATCRLPCLSVHLPESNGTCCAVLCCACACTVGPHPHGIPASRRRAVFLVRLVFLCLLLRVCLLCLSVCLGCVF